MIFSAPGLLWLLPAAAAPFLIHLLSRRRGRPVDFGDLSLLRRVQARALPRARLRELLLVAARASLLALLILAYAGPVFEAGEGPSAAGSDQGLDLLVLLDRSYSMGATELGKSRFETARLEGARLLRGLPASARAAVGFFSDRLEGAAPVWEAPAAAAERLAKAEPGFSGTDYAAAFRAASEAFAKNSGRRQAVLVLSDAQRSGLRGELPELPPSVLRLGLSWGDSPPNPFVAAAGPGAEASASSPRLSVRLSPQPAPSWLEVWEGKRRAASSAVAAGPSERGLSFPLPAPQGKGRPSWSGRAALRPDRLSADDERFYSFELPEKPRVLVLYGDTDFLRAPQAGFFLKEVLGHNEPGLLDYEAEFLPLSRAAEARLGDFRAVVLADFREVPAALSSELERFARRGGGVWVVPGPRAGPDSLAPLESWLPARAGPLVAGEGYGVKLGPGAAAGPWKGFNLDKAGVGRYFLLQVKAGAAVWFQSATGYPLLVAGAVGKGRAALWASGFDPSSTNIAVKPLFAPLVGAVLDDLCGAAGRRLRRLEALAGKPFSRAYEKDEAAPERAQVRGPDGRTSSVFLKDRSLAFGALERPGLYQVREGGGRAWEFAVNLDPGSGESDLSTLGDLPWRPLRAERLAEDFRTAAFGKDARPLILALAALVLLVELFLSLPTARGAAVLALLLSASVLPASAQEGDRLVWTQLRLGPEWDPYPGAHGEVLTMLSQATSVLSARERRIITLKDPDLFSSPLVVLAGRSAPPDLDDEDKRRLRQYLASGGTLWLEDASGLPASSFDRWARKFLRETLPESDLGPLPPDHVVFKTFFLLRQAAGRVLVKAQLEGVSWSGRTAVVYSRNDLLGVWVKDALGAPLFPCLPGGEPQRHNAKKLTVNILMYALTGSYKSDAVHQPYLLQKMRSGIP